MYGRSWDSSIVFIKSDVLSHRIWPWLLGYSSRRCHIWKSRRSSHGNKLNTHGFFLNGAIRYPLKMLPILLLELFWKSFWLLVFALPMYLNHELDQYARDVVFACGMGVVLTPLVIPWRYVINHYVLAKGGAWR